MTFPIKSRLTGKRSQKIGMPPGSLVYIGSEKKEPVQLTKIEYAEDFFLESQVDQLDEGVLRPSPNRVVWINIFGVHDPGIVEQIGRSLAIHPLILEDVMNTSQRPKSEDYESTLYVVLKRIYLKSGKDEIGFEQISFLLMKNMLLTFQEYVEDDFEPVRQRLRQARGKIRKRGADYLCYALMDAIVDSYYSVIEKIGEEVEILEDQVNHDPSPETIKTIQSLKRTLILMHKAIWPVHETINRMLREDSTLVSAEARVYFADVLDHLMQVTETLDEFRNIAIDLMDTYLSFNSHKLNETMKVLTLIATVFIPLTFIAGVYGMNFQYIPELTWRYGYFAVMSLMAVLAIIMLIFFRRRRWL